MFACVFRHTGTVIHMLAHTLVHFTCVLRRQPCKEITSALVVLLCYNTGPAAGELRVPRLPPLGPNSISSSAQRISSLPTRLKSFWCPTLQLPCCLWLLGETQTLHLRWRDAGFWFKKGFFLLSAVPALPCRANSSSAPLAHSSVSREVAGSASQPDCRAPSWLRVCLAFPRDAFELFQPNRAQR